MKYLFAVYFFADERVVRVESRDYVEPVLFKSAVTHKRLSEFAHTDEDCLFFVVVSHKTLDVADKVGNVVADFRFAFRNDRHGQIFFDNGGVFLHRVRKPYGRDVLRTLGIELFEITQIPRHALQRGERY